MRRAGAGLIAAALALAGCKNTDNKSGDDRAPGGVAGRLRAKDRGDREKDTAPAKGPAWLEDMARMPGAGTAVPKAGSWADPADPNFNAKSEAQDAIGGRVLDAAGRPARNVFVRIDEVGAPTGGRAAIGSATNNEGYFFTRGLKPGAVYDLTAEATSPDGKPLTGVVQTKVPNPILLIVLRDDLPPPAGGLPPPVPPGGTFPPEPRPSDKVSDAPRPSTTPKDGAWMPGGKVTGVPPATIGGGTTPKPPAPVGGALPPPDDLGTPPKPLKPENVADAPKYPFKPPAASIPGSDGPPLPPLPTLPRSFGPSGGGRSSGISTSTGGSEGTLSLVDTIGRKWGLDAVKPGTLVLVEFMTSTCVPCQRAVPVLKEMQARYGASGLQLAGVMCDDLPSKERQARAAKYGHDHHLNYALYIEPGDAGTVRTRYDVESYPTALLMSTDGRVLWRGHPGDRRELESAIKRNLGR